jgi:beta-lactam-binding protein with PASTA domain
MPDLSGLSMSEARRRLANQVGAVSFLGSGLVTDQSPLPGEPLLHESKVFVHFSPDAERSIQPPAALESVPVLSTANNIPAVPNSR